MLTVVFSSVATEHWRLSHVLPWGECATQSQMVTFPLGDFLFGFVVVWGDVSCKAPWSDNFFRCHQLLSLQHWLCCCGPPLVCLGSKGSQKSPGNWCKFFFSSLFKMKWVMVPCLSLFLDQDLGKSYDLLVLTVEGGNFFVPFLDQIRILGKFYDLLFVTRWRNGGWWRKQRRKRLRRNPRSSNISTASNTSEQGWKRRREKWMIWQTFPLLKIFGDLFSSNSIIPVMLRRLQSTSPSNTIF